MPDLIRPAAAAAAASLASLALSACGESQPVADPAAVDQHLNKIIRDDEANKARLIEEARDREDMRKREMEQREADYSAANEASAAQNATNTTE